MLYSGGDVWGYREMALSEPYRQMLRLPARNPIPPGSTPMEFEDLGYPTYDYFCSYGNAPDTYADELIPVVTDDGEPFISRMLIITVGDNAVDVQYSFDGIIVNVEKTMWRSDRQAHSLRAFRIRNHTPGAVAWYQFLAMR